MVVVVEGINGSGKTTVVDQVVRCLAARGVSARSIDPACATPWGKSLRGSLVAADWKQNISPTAAAFGFAACRVDGLRAIREVASDVVIFERWSGAVNAYGEATGADVAPLEQLTGAMNSLLNVDLQILIDLPVEAAAARLKLKDAANWYEADGLAILSGVRQSYRLWAESCGATVIDGGRAVELVADNLLALILEKGK